MDRWHDDGFYKPAGLWTEAQMVAVLPTIRPIMRRIWPMLLACREGLDLRREARTSEKEPLPC